MSQAYPTLDERAESYMKAALTQLERGEWAAAAENLQLAATLHLAGGRPYDEARCLQMAASALRAAGETAVSRTLADRAAAVPQSDPRLKLSIVTEQAEGAFAAQDWDRALPLISQAISMANEAGLGSKGRNALLRRRARIYLAIGNPEASAKDYDAAFGLLGPEIAGFARTEQAGALIEEGLVDDAERVLANIAEPADPHLAAERLALQAKVANLHGNHGEAIELADRARHFALEAVAPVAYFSSSAELAEAFQSIGEYTEAYGAMVRAWATLGDLIGKEAATTWIEPGLLGFRIRWGDETYAKARQDYEARRREAKDTQ